MRTWATKVIVFAVLGITLQLAFVWWSVFFHESRWTQGPIKLLGFPYLSIPDRSHSGWMMGPVDQNGNRWRIRIDQNQRRIPFQIRYEAIPLGDGSEREIESQQLPAWSRIPDFPTSAQTRSRLKIVEQVGGWPFRAWRGEYRIDGALNAPRCIACFPDQQQVWLGSWMDVTLYPYRPEFPEVIFNTLIYGGMLFIIFHAVRHYVRRFRRWTRLSRGLCPRCKYDIRGLHTCPECGQQLSKHARLLAARDQTHG